MCVVRHAGVVHETLLSCDCVSNIAVIFWVVDIGRWAARLGRYAFEMVSNVPKGWFRWDRDPL